MGVQSGDDSPWRIHRRAPRRTSAAALRATKLIASRMATEVLLSFRARISLGSLLRQSVGGNVLACDRDKSFERFRSSRSGALCQRQIPLHYLPNGQFPC
jgi:hypothetical protein